ncbi:MAG: CcmD family protein [Chitinophagia bacterium]|nr:CcmD family protein [Chitinophagia bacterium]
MTRIRTFLAGLACLLTGSTTARAQDNARTVEMADAMRSNGKIYVVVAVMATILAGLLLYLVRIDRRVTRLEKDKD